MVESTWEIIMELTLSPFFVKSHITEIDTNQKRVKNDGHYSF